MHKSEWLHPAGSRVSENTAFGFYYAIYYAILFFTTLFTTLREAPANDLYVFWHVPKRQYGIHIHTYTYIKTLSCDAGSSFVGCC